MDTMFDRLRRWLRPRQESPNELAEEEGTRRRAEQELREVELRSAEERQRLEAGGLGGEGRPY
jgi:hypothetical protein